MDLSWIILGLVGWALGFLFVMVLMRMSGDEDRAARHQQKRIDPHSDVTITRKVRKLCSPVSHGTDMLARAFRC